MFKSKFKALAQSFAARGLPALAAGALVLAAGSAHAAAFSIDATDIIAVITAGVTTISAIGIAVLSLVVVTKLFKWVQRVL